MNAQRFDDLTRALVASTSRRRMLQSLGAGAALAFGSALGRPHRVTAREATPAASATGPTRIVRTMSLRDVMATVPAEPINNFYPQGSPKLSADGATAVFGSDRHDGPNGIPRSHVFLMPIGGTPVEIDALSGTPTLDLANDGTRVLVMYQVQDAGPRRIRAVERGGGRTLVEEVSVEMSDAVLAGNGQRIVFALGRDSEFSVPNGGKNIPAPAGIYAIDWAGGQARHLVGREDIRGLIGAKADDLLFFPQFPFRLSVADDGGRIVFTVSNYTTGRTFVLAYDGAPRLLVGPLADVPRVAISGNGATVLALEMPVQRGPAGSEYVVRDFAGEGRRVIATEAETGIRYERGVQLSPDGRLALLGSGGILIRTDTGERIDLAVGCGGFGLMGDELNRLTMSADGRRFLYVTNQAGPLALLELNPASLPAGAPVIADPLITPATVGAGDDSKSTLTARIQVTGTPSICVATLRNGLWDQTAPVGAYGTLWDNGNTEYGDVTAGDGIYTNNQLYALKDAPAGPRTVRVKVESQSTDKARVGVIVDLEPFGVMSAAKS